jgi:hypothetical protein
VVRARPAGRFSIKRILKDARGTRAHHLKMPAGCGRTTSRDIFEILQKVPFGVATPPARSFISPANQIKPKLSTQLLHSG